MQIKKFKKDELDSFRYTLYKMIDQDEDYEPLSGEREKKYIERIQPQIRNNIHYYFDENNEEKDINFDILYDTFKDEDSYNGKIVRKINRIIREVLKSLFYKNCRVWA